LNHKCLPLDINEIQSVYKPAFQTYRIAEAKENLEINGSELSLLDWLKTTFKQE
jgi:hypothetical protein